MQFEMEHLPQSLDLNGAGIDHPAPLPGTEAYDALPQLMLAKPHKTSFPEETFTVKDRFGLDSKREGLNQTSGSYRQFYRKPGVTSVRTGGHRDSACDKGAFRRLCRSTHSHSIVAGGFPEMS